MQKKKKKAYIDILGDVNGGSKPSQSRLEEKGSPLNAAVLSLFLARA